jgi:unsaturated rhamnogalacturonyl hydrolase
MKRLAIIACCLLAACSPREESLLVRTVQSELQRCPTAAELDGLQGRLKWNYTTGLELKAFLDCSYMDELLPVREYVRDWYEAIIDSTGAIGGGYKEANYSLDHICPGWTLLKLVKSYPEEKYFKAIEQLYRQLQAQPRNAEGGFWHKQIYPDQMWLDGLYMAMPFYAEYTRDYVADSLRSAHYEDIVHQFSLAYEHCYDPANGLLRHAWDASHRMFWCDPQTGQSAHAWGRALGWYCMALVEVIDILNQDSRFEDKTLPSILSSVFASLLKVADPETGLWYQVLDCPGREGNYLEATCNAMFAYAMLKGVRLGVLDGVDEKMACQTYEQMVKTFVTVDDAGVVDLNECCAVAGLGGKQMRSGKYDYYVNETIVKNDPKGMGPLIWAMHEYEQYHENKLEK